ncbi:sodium ion-translocating decarboxylase subunit beta [uncultured Thiocystis sp.]|jgi:hypothetical protein|uniref:sodium ion-translocating decarboxylase subunit beta n=1 Tax=uncultured Thiocystis sp. TaxID=1202134 RepID=UPI0025DA36A0|nr:sodium ion-translocating decarboxylase subunit beta [uncultured Thiocystis sp.]
MLLATRMRIEDMLPIAAKLDQVGYWSLETWGGTTFDACIRYLGEDPWDRLRQLKAAMPNTPQQRLLLEEIAAYFREVRKKYARFEGALKGVDSRILVAQVPGGMLTNMENQPLCYSGPRPNSASSRLIQPPIMRALTTHKERAVVMEQMRPVSRLERILFPFVVLILCALLLPSAAPLIGMLTFGNLLREAGVVERLSRAAQNEIINIVTILLGLAVGSKLSADKFLNLETLGILLLGAFAFCIGTAAGVLMGKVMCYATGGKMNPLIGAAGVSAVPMAARVANKVGQETDPHNFLLMHAMGPNVAGVIGSAVAAGLLLALIGP